MWVVSAGPSSWECAMRSCSHNPREVLLKMNNVLNVSQHKLSSTAWSTIVHLKKKKKCVYGVEHFL